jgi:hypothetical protein
MNVSKKKAAAALGAAAVAVAGSGVAFAYWSSTGNGAGSATTGTSTSFTVSVPAVALADLTPGGPSDTIAYTVHNPSTGSQRVHQVVVSVANANGTAWTAVAGCSASDFSLGGGAAGASKTTTPDAVLAPQDNTAGVTTDDYTSSVSLQMVNAVGNQDGCKGVTVPLYVDAS